MAKLSTTPPKQLMNPPMWKMDKPIPSPKGIRGKLNGLVYWGEGLFGKEQEPITPSCETVMVWGLEVKVTDEIMRELDLDLEPYSQYNAEESLKLVDILYCIMKTDGSTICGFHKDDD